MWLLPALSVVSSAASRIYYRFEVSGPPLPKDGPLLVFANHPNSLFDPALVAAAARRPVRFLAKSTLFAHPWVGWLVRAAGAIPVYRRGEAEGAAELNVSVFEAVFEELGRGAAIGIFPEGISHSEPSLAKLKTGTARIALGSWERHRRVFPLIPVGINLRDKGVFRSEAVAIRGEPIRWHDLAARGACDEAAVRALTERIETALRQVTVNLERWRDRPLIETAESIWSAELDPAADPGDRARRAEQGARVLADLRRRGERRWQRLARELTLHRRRLRRLGLQPADLDARVDLASAAGWAARRLHLLAPPVVAIALLSVGLFWLPYRVTDLAVAAARPASDQRSTYKLLAAVPIYLLWIALLVTLAWRYLGAVTALALVAAAPPIGVAGLWILERWRGAWDDARRFFLLRSRRRLWEQLKADQARLAAALLQLYESWSIGGVPAEEEISSPR